MTSTRDDVNISADRSAFKSMVKRCLDHADDDTKDYFEHGLVQRQQVVEMLTEGEAFDQATQTTAYLEYRSPNSKVWWQHIWSASTKVPNLQVAWLNDSGAALLG